MVDKSRARKLLNQAVEGLSVPRDSEIIKRFYLDEDDKSEICEHLGISPSHFDKVLYRAKKRMRAFLEDQNLLRSLLLEGLIDD